MNAATESSQLTRIWDLPIRIYHWLMVILVVLQFGTAKFGWFDMQWHFYFGYALLVLMLFRVGWGLIGSSNARFVQLLKAPRHVIEYVRNWRGQKLADQSGHNPLGAWSSLLLISVVLLQALSGLATTDDIEWYGPLSERLPAAWADWAQWLHHRLEPVLIALIAMHVCAIALYWIVKRDNLIVSMWHGRRKLDAVAPVLASNGRALLLLAICSTLVAALILWSR